MKNERLKRLGQVIQKEATTPSRGDFMATHVPFENLYQPLVGQDPIPEDVLLKDFLLEGPVEHKFIVIRGDNGSGKSHLIRWLKEKYEHEIDPKQEKVMFISRFHNTLQDALRQIVESDIFPPEIQENELKMIKNARSNITGDELKKTINFNFTLEIEADEESDDVILDKLNRKLLNSYLRNGYIIDEFLMRSGGPLDRIRAKLEAVGDSVSESEELAFVPEDFDITVEQIRKHLDVADNRADANTIRLANKFIMERRGFDTRKKVADYLNSKVGAVIRRSIKLQTADFKELFASLRRALKKPGISLTLFIEDITSFAGLDAALMEVLISDHKAEGNEQYCRLRSVAGVTNSFFRSSVPSNIQNRITHLVEIREGAVLGTCEQLARFAARYINAINLSEKQVNEWYRHGSRSEDLPIAPCDHTWAHVDCGYSEPLSIFPFNKQALWRLYNQITGEPKTPRTLLSYVIKHVLTTWYFEPDRLLLDEANVTNAIVHRPQWEHDTYEQSNRNIDAKTAVPRGILLRVWGDGTTNRTSDTLGGLTRDVFNAFGLSFPEQVGGIPEVTLPPPVEPSSNGDEEPEIASRDMEIYSELKEHIKKWAEGDFALTRHIELRDFLRHFIVSGVDWEEQGIPETLVRSYVSRSFIHIEGQPVQIGKGYVLPRNEESMWLLLSLVSHRYLGNSSWDFKHGEDALVTALTWLEAHTSELVELALGPAKRNSNAWNIPRHIVAGQFWLKRFFDAIDSESTAQDLAVALFGTPLDLGNAAVHSEVWNQLADSMQTAPYMANLHKQNVAYFSKAVGGATPGETSYTFVDAAEIIKQIEYLKAIRWDLGQIEYDPVPKDKTLLHHAPDVLQMIESTISEVLEAEKKLAEEYTAAYQAAFGMRISADAIRKAITEMKDFLKYVTLELSMNYDDAQFRLLSDGNSCVARIAENVQELEILLSANDALSALELLSANPFEAAERYCGLLANFKVLLDEKEQIFVASTDTTSLANVKELKEQIVKSLDTMKSLLSGNGGE